MNFRKTLISEFFTTISFSQAFQSLNLMTFSIFKLKKWKNNKNFEELFLAFLWKKDKKIISFYNWRSAIFHCLKMLWLNKNDEVVVNWYNCISVSNAVIQTWAKIIYWEIEKETLSFDFEKLQKIINKNTKAIIIQHTFWKKSRDYKKIINFWKEKWILILEDCAHSLWNSDFRNDNLWNNSEILWDFAIFSTWRDKVISSVSWGFLLINNSKYFNKIKEIKNSLKMPKTTIILQNLFYNIVGLKAYFYYDFFQIWKIIIALSVKLWLITKILTKEEKECNFKEFYFDYPNSLASFAEKQLKNINRHKEIRLKNANFYLKNLKNKKIKIVINNFENYNWFRFPIILSSEEEKNKLYNFMRKNKVLLWNYRVWQNISPIWANLKKAQYKPWSCIIAEDFSKKMLTLPNHKLIKEKDLKRICKLLNGF